MPKTIGRISLAMGPHTLGAPDRLEDAIIGFIEEARTHLYVAVQELESEPIASAIIRARKRGIRVRVMLEGDYLIAKRSRTDPFESSGPHEPNRHLFNALLRARIDARLDYNPNIFHQKFMVRDAHGDTASLLTGSTNFTPTGTGSNLNHLILIEDKRTVAAYLAEFEEIWSGTFGPLSVRRDPKPIEPRVSGVRLKPLFAPDHAPEMEIMKQMLKARESIEFAIFTFSRSSGIDDTMIALARAGIRVRGVLDGGQGNMKWAATRPLSENGVEIHLCPRGAGLNKLHHKLMVIDGQTVIGGSFNYTGPANRLNDENIFVIGDTEETNPESRDRQAELAGYALEEIERIIQVHGEPFGQ